LKKSFAVTSAVLLLVTLAGCSSSGTHAIDPEPMPTYTADPDPTPTFTPKPTPTHTYTKKEIYVSVVRAQYPYYAGLYSDSELVDIAQSACTYFRDGGDFESLAYSLVASLDSTDPDFFGFVGFTIGSGVATYCPEYSYKIS